MTQEIAPGYDVIMYWDVGAPLKSLKLAYRVLPKGGMVLISLASGGQVDRSLNLLTRKLTLVYPDHDAWQETIAKTKAAGFKRVKRIRIKDTAWVVTGYK
jgi:hypothetical protein